MTPLPRPKALDSTFSLMSDPYGFISKTCRELESDLFQTRIMLQQTICMLGEDAARLLYDPKRFVRAGAMPGRIQKTLLGRGGVQGLDGDAHQHRKQMFMSLMTPERIDDLARITARLWRDAARRWTSMERVVLYGESQAILCRAVCEWAGVPLDESEVGLRTRQMTALFDQAGSIGPEYWQARLARRRADRWGAGLIEDIRAGRLNPREETAAVVIARHRDLDGKPLDPRTAAVELLNVLRPTVAVSVFVTLAAAALHDNPGCRQSLRSRDADYPELFVQEVRRYYPFFPVIAARVRREFEWKGYVFPEGRRVLLDVYGTNHDQRTWDEPEEFQPERFRDWDGGRFNFIPQGGGEHHRDHRCPGEWIAIELMKVAIDFLSRHVIYNVPEQDLRIDRSRMPALPRSRFVIDRVQEIDADVNAATGFARSGAAAAQRHQ